MNDETILSQSPGVFISYCWESATHKKWVAEFSSKLRADGIEAILDQWHLNIGDRIPLFMERSIRENEHVLLICTEEYKKRFDERTGGVGYEGNLIADHILENIAKDKFIPVLRSGSFQTSTPSALAGVFGIDMRLESDEEYDRLVRHLHGLTQPPPPLGAAPQFSSEKNHSPEAVMNPTRDALPLPEAYANLPHPLDPDRHTLRGLMNSLPARGIIAFLRDKNFGFKYRWEQVSELEDFLHASDGPEHEFLNPEIETLRQHLRETAKNFLNTLATNTFIETGMSSHDGEWWRGVPDLWEVTDPSRYYSAIHEINSAADKVVHAHADLIRTGRRKLGI